MVTAKTSKRSHPVADAAAQSREQAGAKTRDMAHRAADAVRARTHQLQDQAAHAGGRVVKYIRREPVTSVLIAAAAGAAVMALVDLMLRSRRRD